jgi:hypothetical protein
MYNSSTNTEMKDTQLSQHSNTQQTTHTHYPQVVTADNTYTLAVKWQRATKITISDVLFVHMNLHFFFLVCLNVCFFVHVSDYHVVKYIFVIHCNLFTYTSCILNGYKIYISGIVFSQHVLVIFLWIWWITQRHWSSFVYFISRSKMWITSLFM